ncbi:HAT domain-containing protein [Macrophomina phaseolina MS6]|uniref:HAT domain-containing protein n=1 Tax=Macrophomina phaseolina (strain MS6) TaxID=1126212 RepID=K2QH09_MACPH|nr:HAT domain-containing protein [Macrophomina phaseolina MS6]
MASPELAIAIADPQESQASLPAASAPSTPTPEASSDTTHAVTDIDLSKVRDGRSKQIPGLQYRARHRTQARGHKISWVFDHGADCEDASGLRWFVCKYCQLEGRYNDGVYKVTGTHAIEVHLHQTHKIYNPRKPPAPQYRASAVSDFFKPRFSSSSSSSSPLPASYSLVTPFNDKLLRQSFTDMVIKLDLSFRQASSEELRKVVIQGGPLADRLLTRSPTTVANLVKWSFEDRRKKVQDLVSSAKSKITFSVDMWTSDEGNKKAYLAVNSHFIDNLGTLRTALLSFARIVGPHSGENLAKALYKSITSYGINYTRVGYFVADNADTNDTMLRKLRELMAIDYPACRIRCIGHIINLVVKAILFGKGVSKFEQSLLGRTDDSEEAFLIWSNEGPLGKLHNICVFVNRNDQRRTAFANCQLPEERALDDDADPDGGDEVFYYVLLVDQGVRWCSVYYMIKRALKLRHAIDRFIDRYEHKDRGYDIRQDRLSPHDWEVIKRFYQLLRPFKCLTQYLEGKANKEGNEGSHGSIWESLKAMDFMFDHLKRNVEALEAQVASGEASREDWQDYSTKVDAGYLKLQDYYSLLDESPAYVVAIFLHPNYRFEYFEQAWALHKSWITDAKSAIRRMYDTYEVMYLSELAAGEETEESTTDESTPATDVFTNFEAFGRPSGAKERSRKRRRLDTTQLQSYWDAGVTSYTISDPLAWWRSEGVQYPILQRMAFDIYSIPAMSAEPERIFSHTRRIISDERTRLSDDTIETEICQKH